MTDTVSHLCGWFKLELRHAVDEIFGKSFSSLLHLSPGPLEGLWWVKSNKFKKKKTEDSENDFLSRKKTTIRLLQGSFFLNFTQDGANSSLLTKSSQLVIHFLPPLLQHVDINKGPETHKLDGLGPHNNLVQTQRKHIIYCSRGDLPSTAGCRAKWLDSLTVYLACCMQCRLKVTLPVVSVQKPKRLSRSPCSHIR